MNQDKFSLEQAKAIFTEEEIRNLASRGICLEYSVLSQWAQDHSNHEMIKVADGWDIIIAIEVLPGTQPPQVYYFRRCISCAEASQPHHQSFGK